MTKKILELLHDNSKLTAREIAVMIDKPEAEVAAAIAELEKNKIIVSYKTTINWEKTNYEKVSALIELKVTPQRGGGFEAIAEKIYNYPEVSSLYLMSGAYDIMVIVEGKTMKDVALFVANRLAPMDDVISTATHFVLKKYKMDGTIFAEEQPDERSVITL